MSKSKLLGKFDDVADHINQTYPDKKVVIVEHGKARVVRAYIDCIILWLDRDGSVKKTEFF